MKKLVAICVLLSVLVGTLLTGCGKKNDVTLNVAMMPAQESKTPNAGQEDKVNEDFRLMLEKQLGVKVNLYKSTEYEVGITAMAEGKVDVLLVSPMSYYQASLQTDIEPLATYSSAPGSAVYKTVFITSAGNNNINSLKDLKGKSIAFVDQSSSSGYLYPKYELVQKLGLDPEKLETPGYYFNSVKFSGSHPNSIISVLNGGVDAAAVGLPALDYIPSLKKGATVKDVKIIGETPVIPNPIFIVRADLDDTLKAKLKKAYLNYNNEEYFQVIFGNKAIRFKEADNSSLTDAEKIVKTLGIQAEGKK